MRASFKACALALILAVLASAPTPAAAAGGVIRNPGHPRYTVRLNAGPEGHVWAGHESITFRNERPADLSEVWLRLWSNGVLGCGGHSIRISHVRGGTADPLSVGCTAVRIALASPVAQGDEATIRMHVRIQVPRRNDRFGYHGGLALMGTALPTLAVHDDQGWHLDPFEDLGESFYSIVGTYHVTLMVRPGLDTPTTGNLVGITKVPGLIARSYQAKDVRDFAWAAGRLRQLTTRVGGTSLVVSSLPGDVSRGTAAAALTNARHSLQSLSRAFGRYPYPEMDVVLTAFGAFGGMEYPTIIFTNPPKGTISHELAHQWWYGIVGDDEYTEPWLDESFATWSGHLPLGGWTRCSSYDFPGAGARITNDMGYWAAHPDEYDTIYTGGGCLLANLAHRFGYPRFVRILRGYASDHWLGVTRTSDFKHVIEDAAAADLPGFDPAAFWARWRVD